MWKDLLIGDTGAQKALVKVRPASVQRKQGHKKRAAHQTIAVVLMENSKIDKLWYNTHGSIWAPTERKNTRPHKKLNYQYTGAAEKNGPWLLLFCYHRLITDTPPGLIIIAARGPGVKPKRGFC